MVESKTDTAQVDESPATPEGEQAWLSFLQGMGQQRQQLSQAAGAFPIDVQQPPPSSSHQPSGLAAFPPPANNESGPFAFHLPPEASTLGVGGGHQQSGYPNDVLGRFHTLFHHQGSQQDASPTTQGSTHSSALQSPMLSSSEEASPAQPPVSHLQDPHLPHPHQHHLPHLHALFQPPAVHSNQQVDESSSLNSLFSSFFPPPEPSHFPPGPTPLHTLQQQTSFDRRPSHPPSGAYTFSPTSFSHLHLPDLTPFTTGVAQPVHLPPLRDPLAPPPPPLPLPPFLSPSSHPDPLAPPSLLPPSQSIRSDSGTGTKDASPGSTVAVTPLPALVPIATPPTDQQPRPSTSSSSSTSAKSRKRAAPSTATGSKASGSKATRTASGTSASESEVRSGSAAPHDVGESQSPSAVANETAVEEDKRRRNTEASARFRAKKKNHTVNLTRTVSDLTSRVSELEVEAGDLRRENTWLKEIVVARARGGGAAPSSTGGGGSASEGLNDDGEG